MSETTSLVAPTTARELLLGSQPTPPRKNAGHELDQLEHLDRALDNAGVGGIRVPALARLSPAAMGAVQGQVKALLASMLGKPFSELLVGGWRKLSALMTAARHSLDEPGTPEVVELDSHTVTVTHEPKINVVVDGQRVTTIGVRVITTFHVTGVAASVRDGAIVALEGGRVVVVVSLEVEGVEVSSGRIELDPHLVVPLGDGIVLVSPEPVASVIAPRDGHEQESHTLRS